jgi:hypothetical protein
MLDNNAGSVVAAAHTLRQALAQGQLRQEATHERIAGTIGVHQQLAGKSIDGEGLHLAVGSDDGVLGSLREHNHTRTGAGSLGLGGQLEGDLVQVSAVSLGGAVGSSLDLVTKHEVGVGHDGGHLVGEELNQEGCRQVEHESLVVLDTVASQLQDGLHGDGQEEAGDVEDAGGGDDVGGLGGLEVVGGEGVGGGQVGDQGALTSMDQHSAGAGGGAGVLLVVHVDTILGCTALCRQKQM